MGCRQSVPLEQLLPAYCIRNPKLTAAHVEAVRASWAAILAGTANYKKVLTTSDVAGTGAMSGAASGTSTTAGGSPAAAVSPGSSGTPVPTAQADNVASTASSGNAEAPVAPEDDPRSPLYSPISHLYDLFYSRLFELAPSVRPLFKGSIKTQGRALVKMIDGAVALLERPATLKPALEALAERHVKYGALPAHYGVVGEVLLWTLEQVLGPEGYTDAVKEAWLTTYSVMMSIMLPHAYGRRRRAKPSSAAAVAPAGPTEVPKSSVAAAASAAPLTSPARSGGASSASGFIAGAQAGRAVGGSYMGSPSSGGGTGGTGSSGSGMLGVNGSSGGLAISKPAGGAGAGPGLASGGSSSLPSSEAGSRLQSTVSARSEVTPIPTPVPTARPVVDHDPTAAPADAQPAEAGDATVLQVQGGTLTVYASETASRATGVAAPSP